MGAPTRYVNTEEGMADEPTKEELYKEAQDLDIEGRSTMDKDELEAAVEQAKSEQSGATPATNDQGPAQPQTEVDPSSAGNTVTNPPETSAGTTAPPQDVNIQGEVAASGGGSNGPDTGYSNRPA